MSSVPIPGWTAAGLLPPIAAGNAASPERSPYVVSLSEFALRFATSAERWQVLDGFLRYRVRIHAAGLVQGFQWLDGSFLEDIEAIEGRPPRDLDVVTFYRLPPGVTQAGMRGRAPDVFPMTRAERIAFKGAFSVDPYLVHLNAGPERLVTASAYWYSMWRGYLQVDLSPAEDATARGHLTAPPACGGTP